MILFYVFHSPLMGEIELETTPQLSITQHFQRDYLNELIQFMFGIILHLTMLFLPQTPKIINHWTTFCLHLSIFEVISIFF